MDKKKTKTILYTLIFIPVLIAISEIFLVFITKFFNIRFPNQEKDYVVKHHQTFDLITGANKFKFSKVDIQNENSFINRHGLIRTIHSNKGYDTKDIKGVAILGNSVAAGAPVIYQGNYKNSFINLLEKKLRKEDERIDIINLSNNGFNSWQENVQLAKYFNSQTNFNDLPKIKLVASIGGIQDFWSFITLLNNNDSTMNNFHMANGLMSIKYKNQFLFFNLVDNASKGNIASGLKVFLKSIIKNIKNSYSYRTVNLILRENSSNNKRTNSNQEIVNLKSKSISEVISNKLFLSTDEYNKKKSEVIQSVLRNYQSIVSLNPESKFLFIYLPTKFGFSKNQINVLERYKYNNLNVLDLHLLEVDYRSSLIKALNKLKNLEVYDLSNKGSFDWFYDESHYSIKGHKDISKILFPVFSNVLEKIK